VETTLLKSILLTLLQFLAFGALLILGSFWALVGLFYPRLTIIPVWRFHVSATQNFVADGVIFAVVLLGVLLLIEALRKVLKPWGRLTVLAFVLAVTLSLVMKLGFLAV
jgi:hypothetical protein